MEETRKARPTQPRQAPKDLSSKLHLPGTPQIPGDSKAHNTQVVSDNDTKEMVEELPILPAKTTCCILPPTYSIDLIHLFACASDTRSHFQKTVQIQERGTTATQEPQKSATLGNSEEHQGSAPRISGTHHRDYNKTIQVQKQRQEQDTGSKVQQKQLLPIAGNTLKRYIPPSSSAAGQQEQ